MRRTSSGPGRVDTTRTSRGGALAFGCFAETILDGTTVFKGPV